MRISKGGVSTPVALISIVVALLIGLGGMYVLYPSINSKNSSSSGGSSVCPNNLCTLGGLRDLSGVDSSAGLPGQAAEQLAIQDINSMLARTGNPTRFAAAIDDAASDPTTALTQFQNLVASGVQVCICADDSGEASNILSYANQHHVVVIAISSSVSLAYPNRGYLYRMVPDDADISPALSQLIYKDGYKALITVYRNDAFGSGAANATNAEFKALGGALIDSIGYSTVSSGSYDFTSILGQVNTDYQKAVSQYGANATAIDVVSFAEISVLIQQAKSLYPNLLNTTWFSSDGIPGDSSVITGNGALEAQVKLIGTTWAPVNSTALQNFTARVEAKTGGSYNLYASGIYDGTWIAALSILACGSYNGTCVYGVLPSIAAHYTGVSGPTMLDSVGDLVASSQSIWEILPSSSGTASWQVVGSLAPGGVVSYFSNYAAPA